MNIHIQQLRVSLACLLSLPLLLPAVAEGQLASEYIYNGQLDYAYQSLVYEFTSNGLTLVGWQGTGPEGDPSVPQVVPSELLIPAPLPGLPPLEYPVSSIGAGAFVLCIDLPSLTIPATVTNIGDRAFCDCVSLNSVYCLGNAPTCSFLAFTNDFGPPSAFDFWATVYYLPGTTGWSNTFAGIPTVLWTPELQTSNASFGVQTSGFGFTINWASGMSVAVDASTSLVSPAWVPLATNTLTSGSVYFSDPDWTNYPARFYRLRWP